VRFCRIGFRYRHGQQLAVLAILAVAATAARAAEHVTLRNGFEFDCSRRETIDAHTVRLFLLSAGGSESNYIDIAAAAVATVETFPDPVTATLQHSDDLTAVKPAPPAGNTPQPAVLTPAEMHLMLAHAGGQHHIDEDLLASVVKAESGGQVFAVSRTGARGLMQLMPETASGLGVNDAFRPEENIAGGTAYLDQLLTRYHDNVALALAAYNAGPGAVDRYKGIPPYRETRAYVARVIREFNRRKLDALSQANRASLQTASTR